MNPDVSVIIPFYNRPERVRQAYDSVCAQTMTNIEIILVDDGSDDENETLQRLLDSRGHRYIRIEHQGVSAARNAGIGAARAPWIALLDSDDAWLPEKLARQCAFHICHPELMISQTEDVWYRQGVRVHKKKKQREPEGDIFLPSLSRCLVSSSTTLIHRSVFETVGRYNEELLACEDYDIWLRMALRFQFGLLPEPLVIKYAGHQDQLSRKYPAMDRYRVYALLKILTTCRMTDEQEILLLKELKRKLSILRKGAEKKQGAFLTLVQQLEETLREYEGDTSQRFSNSLLKELLRDPEREFIR